MCKHELKLLSPPVVDIDVSILGGGGYSYPPIFQCIKCLKVFKTGWNETSLVEILIDELSDEDKNRMSEPIDIERKSKLPIFWFLLIMSGIGMIGIIITLFLLTLV